MMCKYTFAALGAGIFWGLVGVFTRGLEAFGIGAYSSVLIQSGVSAVCFLILNLIKGPIALRIKLSDLWIFFGAGVGSQFLSTYTYFKAIECPVQRVCTIGDESWIFRKNDKLLCLPDVSVVRGPELRCKKRTCNVFKLRKYCDLSFVRSGHQFLFLWYVQLRNEGTGNQQGIHNSVGGNGRGGAGGGGFL